MTCNCTGACKVYPYRCGGGPTPLAGTGNTSGPILSPGVHVWEGGNYYRPYVSPQLGWKCPSCQTIYSPYVQKCLNTNCSPLWSANNNIFY